MECSGCFFWDTGSFTGAGYCRRNPPSVELNQTGTVTDSAVWPVTKSYDWCGEYVERDK
ncbi:hypothetical protein [Puniceibacterium antarcticum]|uniref:hypothetical protein n=1 Tax=Puniceibacterium antarcticum TaxID=1206336 RepID=UPI0015D4AAF8|nr:hypothetical protein [Puniceibacterium antarcticum]